MNEREKARQLKILQRLQEVDFALVELTLYLDTHPHDQEAFDLYKRYAKKSHKIREIYESRYGPLLQYGLGRQGSRYRWHKGPWPWEL
ncbi:spore coat protein CotJB [Staphylospora marina]|uniref:spore coat protein CotJB n=1 Tax=Staphylospora marina TaxID=2490858 RepID=UPI000F5BCD70|nr:spore coat protein CotJB [Staphylospora marina]